jgi:hypothetical protein
VRYVNLGVNVVRVAGMVVWLVRRGFGGAGAVAKQGPEDKSQHARRDGSG